MNRKFVIVIITFIIVIILSLSRYQPGSNLISPLLSLPKTNRVSATPIPTSVPPQAPQTFKFNRSTDLKKELDQVNPAVTDQDFK